MRVPSSMPPDQQQSLREIWQAIDALRTQQTLNLDLHGKRIINAGDGQAATDYVTKEQLDHVASSAPTPSADGTFQTLTVDGLARFLGGVKLPKMTDGSNHHVILFVDSAGALAGVNDGIVCFAFNDVTGSIELGYGLRLNWLGLGTFGSNGATDGVLTATNEAGTGFTRFVLGPDDATGIALVKNGTQLEIRVAGAAGALTTLLYSGGAGAFATLVIGTDPGGADILRVGGSLTVVNVHASGAVDGASVVAGTDPGGAEPLRVGGGIMEKDPAGVLLHTANALANGAGASTGTLGNAPAASDPTKWIEIDDNGTIRKIPAW